MSYTVRTNKSWHETQQELSDTFKKWGIKEWTTNYPRGARLSAWQQSEVDRLITLTYVKNGKTINLQMGKQNRAVDNLRVLYLVIEDMRMSEKRGISEVLESAYMQLGAPKSRRNPHEILGISPDSPLQVAEAAYRTLASKYHPDSKPNGDTEKFKEISEAIKEIREKAK